MTRSEIAGDREQLRQSAQAQWNSRIGAVRRKARGLEWLLGELAQEMEGVPNGERFTFGTTIALFDPGDTTLVQLREGSSVEITDERRMALIRAKDAIGGLRGSLPGDFSEYANGLRPGNWAAPESLGDEEREQLEALGKDAGRPWLILEAQPLIARGLRLRLLEEDAALAGRLATLRERIGIRPFLILLALLVGLLIAGVISPMVFIDAHGWESKVPLLVLFAGFSLALLSYYGYELYRLSEADNLTREHL